MGACRLLFQIVGLGRAAHPQAFLLNNQEKLCKTMLVTDEQIMYNSLRRDNQGKEIIDRDEKETNRINDS